MKTPFVIRVVHPIDARGWIGLGCYILVLIVLGMMWADKAMIKDEFFKVIATAIVLNGWGSGPVGWAYQSTKSGNEMAASSQRIAEVAAGLPPESAKASTTPQPVVIQQPADQPVPVETADERPGDG